MIYDKNFFGRAVYRFMDGKVFGNHEHFLFGPFFSFKFFANKISAK